MYKNDLFLPLKIGVAAGLGSALFQSLLGGLDNIDYLRATTVGAIATVVFFFFRIAGNKKDN